MHWSLHITEPQSELGYLGFCLKYYDVLSMVLLF